MSISKVNVSSTEHQIVGSPRYATCSTTAATAAKVASIVDGSSTFTLEKGARICVKFTNENSVAAPTLNVGSTGAKVIYWHGVALASSQYWQAGAVIDFVYDGSQWELVGVAKDNDTNTKVAQNKDDTTNSNFPILYKNTANSTNETNQVKFDSAITVNPSTNTITASKFIGDLPEAYLTWGGKNFSGSYAPIDSALNPVLSANRLAGIKPAGVTIEYSNDGGTTWTNYGATDATKTALFTTSATFRIAGPTASASANSKLRITIDGIDGGVYTQLNKIHIYLSTNYSNGTTVSMESYDYNSSTSWHSVITNQAVSGWSGWNVLNFKLPGSGAFGGSNSSTHQRKIRLTFSNTSVSSGHESGGLQVNKIYAYGGVGWTTPSNLAKNGVPYDYNYNLDVTFPSNITASKFIGPLNGNADTATKAGSADKLTTSRKIELTSDVTGSTSFDGSKDVSITATLKNSGVTAGSYGPSADSSPAHKGTFTVPEIKVDAKGRVTSASNRKITLPADNNTTYSVATSSANGLMSSDDKSKLDGIAKNANNYSLPTAGASLGGVKTTSTVTSTAGLTACPIISGVPYYKDTNTTYSLSSFGVNASATELNYTKGVTSSIQTQLNNKAASSHTHAYLPTAGGTMTGAVTTKGIKLTENVDYGTTLPTSPATNQLFFQTVGSNFVLDNVYPVGAVYMSMNSTNPGTLFGGTWEQVQGKFLLGASSSYPSGSSGNFTASSGTSKNVAPYLSVYIWYRTA